MNYYFLIITGVLILTSLNVKAQDSLSTKKHSFGIAPIIGYDFNFHDPSFGGGLLYEYKPFQKVSFYSSLSYEQTRRNISKDKLLGSQGDFWKHEMYSLVGGARYYFGRFYISAGLGLAYEATSMQMANGDKEGGKFNYALYRSLAAGYQVPLKNNNMIEIETAVSGTKASTKGGLAARYKF